MCGRLLRRTPGIPGNDICNELADNFQISLTIGGSINEAINEVFEGDPSPEELLRRMKETKAGRKIEERLNDSFYKLEDSSDGSTKFYSVAGITGLDRFRIDGKSAKELWGDKYASVKNANDRDMLIKTELFRELLLGNSQIRKRSLHQIGCIHRFSHSLTPPSPHHTQRSSQPQTEHATVPFPSGTVSSG